eukprot:TRINITY_DN18257_c0_g1_i1.p1 TRINITY_DN18257_c0_g1~~TRINITY_DN18257_c0_g1_i1.p1  ORF type:complete len:497 (-),score=79.22 TRINITY_DN18257_c0_g1_i1:154-1488(-)
MKACQPKQPLPLGLAQWMDLSPFCKSDTMDLLFPFYIFFSLVYSFGQLQIISLSFMLFLVVSTNTVNNSAGAVYHGNQLAGMILLVQLVGNINFKIEEVLLGRKRREDDKDTKLIWYTQQTLAGAYLVCALTKQILTSGRWIQRAKYLAMGLLSINERAFVTFGSSGSALTPALIEYLNQHPVLCSWFFAPGFIFEFIFPLFLYNRFTLLIGGIMLLTMHLLINYFMRLEFGAFKIVLVAYCINVPFWVEYLRDLYLVRSGKPVPQHLKQEEKSPQIEDHHIQPSVHKTRRGLLGRLRSVWRRVPLKVMVSIVITCLVLKEFFPFSNFPMFGAPRDITGYFQVRTHDDKILTQNEYFSWTLAKVSKFLRAYCKDQYGEKWADDPKNEFACGNVTLDTLMNVRAVSSKSEFLKANQPLKLIKVEYVFVHENNTIARSERLVGLYP